MITDNFNNNLPVSVFWFRRDLRLVDNAGLYKALNSGVSILPIFIFDPAILNKLNDKNDARVNFIHKQLTLLNYELHKNHSAILTFNQNPVDVFKYLINKYNIQEIYTNTDYEPYTTERDNEVAKFLGDKGIPFHTIKDHVIFEKNEITKDDGKPYTVFTPYMKKWKQKLENTILTKYPSEKHLTNFVRIPPLQIISLSDIGFGNSLRTIPDFKTDIEIISNYDESRDYPAIPTTKIGPHLRFGTVSIRKIVELASKLNNTWLNELIWREFFQMIIYHFPYSAEKSFKIGYDRIEWSNNEKHFKAWCEGKTGIPLVDAGMRELNETGFMHNRVRMVVASFLCKNLLIDWRWGEAYFAEKLLDFELASNVGNWQWAAGSGCDAAPYFRVFNPLLQAEKYDKNMVYIKKWVPEAFSGKYPKPIVDIKQSSKKAVEVYRKALENHLI